MNQVSIKENRTMNNEFITLAIHTYEKANVLKSILEQNRIEVRLKKVGDNAGSYYIEIKSSDLAEALSIIEANRLFRYDDEATYRIDDGRQRILVAVDFSPYSLKACQVAFNIAKEINAKVKMLHVYQDMYFPSHIPFADSMKETPDEEGLLDKSRRKMLRLCVDIDKKIGDGEWPSVNYSYSLREGTVEEEIDNFAKEYKPTLLVIGTKGKDNNERDILGSVAADVIEVTNVPVLAVPESSPINKVSDIKHIAFLTNLQNRDLSSFDALVKAFGVSEDVKITFVHINKNDKKSHVWTEQELIEISHNFSRQYAQKNVTYKLIDAPEMDVAINEFIKAEKVNIVSLTTRKRSIWGRIFAPSVSRKILGNSEVALFVFRG